MKNEKDSLLNRIISVKKMFLKGSPIPVLAVLMIFAAPLKAQILLNLDFEKMSSEGLSRPWGWRSVSHHPDVVVIMDEEIHHSGRYSLKISGKGELKNPGKFYQYMQYWIPPFSLKGQEIKISGWVRADQLEEKAYLQLETQGDYKTLDSDKIEIEPESSGALTADWRFYEMKIKVDPTAYSIMLTLGMNGTGTVRFDDFKLHIGDRELSEIPVAPEITDEEMSWIHNRVLPVGRIETSPADRSPDFSDLKAFQNIFDDAKIIALGESTHGTREFFQLKHRLLDFAVRELGFSIFAIEANQLAVESINDYVRFGKGDVQTAMTSLFNVWRTHEVRNLIEWMRAYNLNHSDRMVEFVGFDMQDPRQPIEALLRFLSNQDSELAAEAEGLLSDYKAAWEKQRYPRASAEIRTKWKSSAETILNKVRSSKEVWLQRAESDAEKIDIEWAVQNARVIFQAADAALSQNPGSRDKAMAENIKWLLDLRGDDTRAVVWAHNAHICRGGISMGSFLSKMYGTSYRALGLMTYSGAYSASISISNRKIISVDAFPAPQGSLEEVLHRISEQKGDTGLFLDLRPVRTHQEELKWLLEAKPARSIGYASMDYGFESSLVIPYHFDAVIFIDKTTGSRIL